LLCYEKDANWASCNATCTPGIDSNDPVEHQTPWSCTLLSVTTTTTTDTIACTASAADCRASRCCIDPSMQCFEKDQDWASCKSTCTPGIDSNDPVDHQTPWSCVILSATTTTTSGQRICALTAEDCSSSRCCADPNLICYEKNQDWATCKSACTPGIDTNDPVEFQSPWSCNELHPGTATTTLLNDCSLAGTDCRATTCCADPQLTCYEKDTNYATCMSQCVAGINENDPPEYRTPWTCNPLGAIGTTTTTTSTPLAVLPCSGQGCAVLTRFHTCVQSCLNDRPPLCAPIGMDCRESRCCIDVSLTCYEKDNSWASCKPSCTPGIDPNDPIEHQSDWTCNPLTLTATTTTALGHPCSATGMDCTTSKCCHDPSLVCYEKNTQFATCKSSCTPGIDPDDPLEYQTPWSCTALSVTTTTTTTTACSDINEDCTATRCCADGSLHCYQKNENWASCNATCTPGINPNDPVAHQTPWSCTLLSSGTTFTTTTNACAVEGADCRGTRCCADPSMICYEKDTSWASCKAACTPGIDPNDAPEFQTAWTCNPLLGQQSDHVDLNWQTCGAHCAACSSIR